MKSRATRLYDWVIAHPPPGPFHRSAWRSPLRGTWLTSVFGLVLLVGLPVVIITGLLSYVAYGPQYGQAFPGDVGWLHPPSSDWPTAWHSLYRVTQGLHVALGIALIPVVLAKLWSVIPKLFTWPPAVSVKQAVERISLLMLVGGILFELVTGVLNTQYDYIFGFDFYTAHYWGAWIFIAGFVVHVGLKLPTMLRTLRTRSLRTELRTPLPATVAEPQDENALAPVAPAPASLSRRGLFGLVAGSSALLTVATLGNTVGGGSLRWTAFLSVRGLSYGDGPTDFQVNRTARTAKITPAMVGPAWRLRLTGGGAERVLTREQLLAMPQHTATLPIACVEGWSSVQTWTGVRLRDLAALAGASSPHTTSVRSLERRGAFNHATYGHGQVHDEDALLALRVNGVDLSIDHGYPARVIIPALPGVHQTKWVTSMDFRGA